MIEKNDKQYQIQHTHKKNREYRGDFRKDRKRNGSYLSIHCITLRKLDSTQITQRAAFSNHKSECPIEACIKCPEIGRPVAVNESTLKRKEARKELLEILENVSPEYRIQRQEEC